MDFSLPINASAKKNMRVESAHTAKFIGSGGIEVLATPIMIALMEAAALEAVQLYLPKGWTTVGCRVDVEHLRPSALGQAVMGEAVLVKVDDRVLDFAVKVTDRNGVVGQGTHRRIIVNIDRFLKKLK